MFDQGLGKDGLSRMRKGNETRKTRAQWAMVWGAPVLLRRVAFCKPANSSNLIPHLSSALSNQRPGLEWMRWCLSSPLQKAWHTTIKG